MKIENVDNIIELLERSKNSTCDVGVIKMYPSSCRKKEDSLWHVYWHNESLEQIKRIEYYIGFTEETSTIKFTITASFKTNVVFTFPITDTEHAKLESFLYFYRDYYENKTMEFLDSFFD